jgi:hypothetical protein
MMRRRVGRPGLVRTVARTAVVAGTATAASGRVQRHQQEKAYAAQEEQAAASPQEQMPEAQAVAPAPATDLTAELERLASLKASGALSDDEFAQAKAKLLA